MTKALAPVILLHLMVLVSCDDDSRSFVMTGGDNCNDECISKKELMQREMWYNQFDEENDRYMENWYDRSGHTNYYVTKACACKFACIINDYDGEIVNMSGPYFCREGLCMRKQSYSPNNHYAESCNELVITHTREMKRRVRPCQQDLDCSFGSYRWAHHKMGPYMRSLTACFYGEQIIDVLRGDSTSPESTIVSDLSIGDKVNVWDGNEVVWSEIIAFTMSMKSCEFGENGENEQIVYTFNFEDDSTLMLGSSHYIEIICSPEDLLPEYISYMDFIRDNVIQEGNQYNTNNTATFGGWVLSASDAYSLIFFSQRVSVPVWDPDSKEVVFKTVENVVVSKLHYCGNLYSFVTETGTTAVVSNVLVPMDGLVPMSAPSGNYEGQYLRRDNQIQVILGMQFLWMVSKMLPWSQDVLEDLTTLEVSIYNPGGNASRVANILLSLLWNNTEVQETLSQPLGTTNVASLLFTHGCAVIPCESIVNGVSSRLQLAVIVENGWSLLQAITPSGARCVFNFETNDHSESECESETSTSGMSGAETSTSGMSDADLSGTTRTGGSKVVVPLVIICIVLTCLGLTIIFCLRRRKNNAKVNVTEE